MSEDNNKMKMPNEFPMMCPMMMGMNFCPMMMQYAPPCMCAQQHMGFPNPGLMMNSMNMMPNNLNNLMNPMMNSNMMPNTSNNPMMNKNMMSNNPNSMMGAMPYSPQMHNMMNMNTSNTVNMKPVPIEEIRD